MIHGDMDRSSVFFQYTTTGWMMWNWLMSGLAVGATIVLFDGSPFKPDAWILWDIAERLHVTHFGTSAKYIQSLQDMNMHPAEKYALKALRDLYSTGSPLRPENFDFIYKHIKSDVRLGSITGGTDIISLFAGHCHALPVHRGEIQCRCLGMAVQAWQSAGKPVYGESADLVCVKPFPSMPVYFWNDPDHKKYKDAYFSHYDGKFLFLRCVLLRKAFGITATMFG
jgi:acetoacetyl-CoA synthetase